MPALRALLLACAFSMLLPAGHVLAEDSITLQDLEGLDIHYQAVMSQQVRKNGERYASQTTFDGKVMLREGGTVLQTSTATSRGRDGQLRTGKTQTSEVKTIEKPGVGDMGRGKGHVVWLIEGDSLIMLRTYKSGAHKKVFKFTRTPQGLDCKYDHVWAFEGDNKPIEVTSAVDGAAMMIYSYKQISSKCRTVKKTS